MSEDIDKICYPLKRIPTILGKVKRIIVLGDIHGDYDYTIELLKIGKIINIDDGKIKWIGKDTIVVQVGDQIDNCRPPLSDKLFCNSHVAKNDEASDIKILELFNELHLQAQKDGGKVISLLGNHEILNV